MLTLFRVQDVDFRHRNTGQFASFLGCFVLLFRSNYSFRVNQLDLVRRVTGSDVGSDSGVYTACANDRQGGHGKHNLPLAWQG